MFNLLLVFLCLSLLLGLLAHAAMRENQANRQAELVRLRRDQGLQPKRPRI